LALAGWSFRHDHSLQELARLLPDHVKTQARAFLQARVKAE
jgi:hypothetical protein